MVVDNICFLNMRNGTVSSRNLSLKELIIHRPRSRVSILGLTVADLVMPWFMFMMGVSFTFSMKSMIRRGFSKKEIFMKMSLRALQLLVLGLFVINKNDDYKA